MVSAQLVNFCSKNGFLLDRDVLNLFEKVDNYDSLKKILDKLKFLTQKSVFTLSFLELNKEKLNRIYFELNPQEKESFLFLKEKFELGDFKRIIPQVIPEEKEEKSEVNILINHPAIYKKLEVKDFLVHFKKRFSNFQNLLMGNPTLKNLTSIGKISGNQQGISIIGMILDKQTTKNKNIILTVEDTSGTIKVIINKDKKEICSLAEEISLDSVLGFTGAGNKEVFFVNEIVFPDCRLDIRKKALVEEYALFVADLHFGSKLFLKDSFNNFIDYLCGKAPNSPEVSKIKYLFFIGDVVSGVGNYPDQEKDLAITDLEEQFIGLANILDKIPKSIKIIISPGNHDGVRIMEPQPLLDQKYAWALYNLPNVIMVGNPSTINIAKREGFAGFNVLMYHGFSFPYFSNTVQSLMKIKAMNCPDKIMHYLLKCRHLAPTHGASQYFPSDKDFYFINPVPDIFVSGHTHKSEVSYYNNILVISASCWEAMTSYQEKMGSKPDHCKVPMFNLATRAVRILDFEEEHDKQTCGDK